MMKREKFWKVFWTITLFAAGAVHFGTAAFRIQSFNYLDFSSYYVAATASRLDISPYPFSAELLASVAETHDFPDKLPQFNSPPLWAWLLQPLATLPLVSAAVLWLVILFAITICCHVLLIKIAGYKDWRIILFTLPITVTFGPVFLSLTLGQNAIVLLLCALIMGEFLRKRSRYFSVLWIPVWIVAVAGKIFPVLWLGCRPFITRPRRFLIASVFCLAAFLGAAWLKPAVNDSYWRHFIVHRTQKFTQKGVGIDDQAINAYFSRIGKSRKFVLRGINLQEKHKVIWNMPWEFSDRSIFLTSLTIVVLLGIWLLYSWIRSRNRSPDRELYSLILFTLVFFPHMQRYNHLLALPAMALLWQRGGWGRNLAIAAYALFALSRLNHVWAIYFPSTLASMASGFGLFGVLILFIGVTCSFLMLPREQHPTQGEAYHAHHSQSIYSAPGE